MPDEQWYIVIEGEQLGPMSKEEMIDLFTRGRARRNDLVWRDGFETWRPASRVDELQTLIPTGPPPTPRPLSEVVFVIVNFFRMVGRVAANPEQSIPRVVAAKPIASAVILIAVHALVMALYRGTVDFKLTLQGGEATFWAALLDLLRLLLIHFLDALVCAGVFYCCLLAGFRVFLQSDNTSGETLCVTGLVTIPLIPATALGWIVALATKSRSEGGYIPPDVYFLVLGAIVSALYLYAAVRTVAKQEPRKALYFVPLVATATFVFYLLIAKALFPATVQPPT